MEVLGVTWAGSQLTKVLVPSDLYMPMSARDAVLSTMEVGNTL